MGVEFNNCPACDEVYCDAGEYHHCKKCGHSICGDCEWKYSEIHQDDPDFCPFCCGDIVTNNMKLEAIKNLVNKSNSNLANKIKEILNRN